MFGRWGECCNLADSYCPAFHTGDQVLHLLNKRIRESSANSHEQLLPGNFLFPTREVEGAQRGSAAAGDRPLAFFLANCRHQLCQQQHLYIEAASLLLSSQLPNPLDRNSDFYPGGVCHATRIRRSFPRTSARIFREFTRKAIGITSKLQRKCRNIFGEFLSEAARIRAQDPSQSLELIELHGTNIASW